MMNKEITAREEWLNKWFYLFLIIGILVNATGLFITILDSDGTLYAYIAKNIAQTNDFINLKVVGRDWLDKPHFPFWMAALSYKVFGINTLAYKIPAFLFWGIGAYYTYLFAIRYYTKAIAQLSVLIYISATHLFISNNDVRAEPYLTGLLIGSVYHFSLAFSNEKWIKHMVIASFYAGCALMTKGPFILIAIGGGFIVEWLVKKDYKQFYSIKWIVALVLILLFTIPELYCLYQQFDLHPEKIVFDKTGVSGIRFFFWDSQFGRFFNNGPIKGEGDKFFYVHTMIWAFLPWGILFYMAFGWLLSKIKASIRLNEYITLGGGGLMFLIFSLSRFQLPHYLNILFPFFAIITAQYFIQITKPSVIKAINGIQYFLIGAVLLIMALLIVFYRPEHYTLAIIFFAMTTTGCIFLFKGERLMNIFGKSFVAITGVFLFLNTCIYPSLMDYQAGSNVAFYVNKLYPEIKTSASLYETPYSYMFYTKSNLLFCDVASLKANLKNSPLLVYTNKDGLDSLKKYGIKTNIPVGFNYFHTSQLTSEFINYKTRESTLTQHYLVKVSL